MRDQIVRRWVDQQQRWLEFAAPIHKFSVSVAARDDPKSERVYAVKFDDDDNSTTIERRQKHFATFARVRFHIHLSIVQLKFIFDSV